MVLLGKIMTLYIYPSWILKGLSVSTASVNVHAWILFCEDSFWTWPAIWNPNIPEVPPERPSLSSSLSCFPPHLNSFPFRQWWMCECYQQSEKRWKGPGDHPPVCVSVWAWEAEKKSVSIYVCRFACIMLSQWLNDYSSHTSTYILNNKYRIHVCVCIDRQCACTAPTEECECVSCNSCTVNSFSLR